MSSRRPASPTPSVRPLAARRAGAAWAWVLVLLAVGCLAAFFVLRARASRPAASTTASTTAASSPPGRGGAPAGSLPAGPIPPLPPPTDFNGCPAQGDGGDALLNKRKNRDDVPARYAALAFDAVESLPWPRSIERHGPTTWSRSDAAAIAKSEGLAVTVEGYLARAKKEGPESCNCHGADDAFRDFHMWLVKAPGADRTASIVVEVTPRFRARHAGWTLARFNDLANAGARVRVSGWLLMDPEHPDQVGKTRGTIWEIHPITQVDVDQDGRWVPLDDATVPHVGRGAAPRAEPDSGAGPAGPAAPGKRPRRHRSRHR